MKGIQMKVSCNIIRDILPLYAEDMVCEETRELVDEHLCGCDECTKELAALKKKEAIPVSVDTAPMEHIRKAIRRRQILTTVCVILTIVSLVWSGMVYMTAPIYFPAEKAIEGVELREDGGLAIDYASGIMGHGGGGIGDDEWSFVHTTRYDWLRGRNWDRKKSAMSQEELEAYIRELYQIPEVTQKDYDRFNNIQLMYCFQNENGVNRITYQKNLDDLEEGITWKQTQHSYDLWYLTADGKLGTLLWQGGDGERPPEDMLGELVMGINKELLFGFLGSVTLLGIFLVAAWKLKNETWRKRFKVLAVFAGSLTAFLLLGTGFRIVQLTYLLRGDWGRDLVVTTGLLAATTLLWMERQGMNKKGSF